jgi:hypothetical protein
MNYWQNAAFKRQLPLLDKHKQPQTNNPPSRANTTEVSTNSLGGILDGGLKMSKLFTYNNRQNKQPTSRKVRVTRSHAEY